MREAVHIQQSPDLSTFDQKRATISGVWIAMKSSFRAPSMPNIVHLFEATKQARWVASGALVAAYEGAFLVLPSDF